MWSRRVSGYTVHTLFLHLWPTNGGNKRTPVSVEEAARAGKF